jgi:hypothetical protein
MHSVGNLGTAPIPEPAHRRNIPRCVVCRRCTWRACHAQREQTRYGRRFAASGSDPPGNSRTVAFGAQPVVEIVRELPVGRLAVSRRTSTPLKAAGLVTDHADGTRHVCSRSISRGPVCSQQQGGPITVACGSMSPAATKQSRESTCVMERPQPRAPNRFARPPYGYG